MGITTGYKKRKTKAKASFERLVKAKAFDRRAAILAGLGDDWKAAYTAGYIGRTVFYHPTIKAARWLAEERERHARQAAAAPSKGSAGDDVRDMLGLPKRPARRLHL
jgi:hypothetical protein